MTQRHIDHSVPVQRTFVIHPIRSTNSGPVRDPAARLEEAIGLALALDLEITETALIPLRGKTPATLFGSGKVEELRLLCEVEEIDVVVVDDQLTPSSSATSNAPGR